LPCACSMWFPFSLHYVPGAAFVPHADPWYCIALSFQSYASAPHSFGSLLPFHCTSSIKSVSHYPSSFPTHFQWYVFHFCVELTPKNNILNFPHRPLVVQKIKTFRVSLSKCLWSVHSFQPITFQKLRSYLTSNPFISLSFHAFTSAPHSFGSLLPFHCASSINPVSHYPSHFPTHFQRYVFIFSDESPMR